MVFTTADVPSQYLKDAFLVGHTPHRALQSDKRLSYTLYVPPTQYDGKGSTKIPLLIFVHGTGRNLAPMRHDIQAFADEAGCAVLAPLFPAGLEGPQDLDSYKLTATAALRSDLAVLAMVDEIGRIWVGIQTKQFFLMGFSGGGQYAHRFLYLHPERLLAVSVGAPGSVTLLDLQKNWPGGVKNMEEIFGRAVDLRAMKAAATQLVVGSADDEVHGGADFTRWLETFNAHQQQSGQAKSPTSSVHSRGRLQSLHELDESLKQASVFATFETVQGVAHQSDSVRPAQLRFMKEHISSNRSRLE